MVTISIISILICLYFYLRVFYLNNPKDDRWVFLLGTILGFMLSLLPIGIIQFYFKDIFESFQFNYKLNIWNGFWDQFFNVLLHVGILEEGTKLLIILIGLFCFSKVKSTKERASIIFLIAAGVSLGFSFIENIIYAYNYKDLTIIFLRSLISTIIHVLCGVEMGYGLSHLFLSKGKLTKIKWLLYLILIPIIIHSLYDTTIKAIDSTIIIYLIIIVTIFSYEWVGHRIYKLRNILKDG